MLRISGHTFSGRPCTVPCGNELGIGVCLPGPIDLETQADLQNATELEVLDDKTGRLSEAYHLTSWYGIESVESHAFTGLAFYWKVSWYDEVSVMQYVASQLKSENETLRKNNADLTAGIIELGSILGGTDTSDMITEEN